MKIVTDGSNKASLRMFLDGIYDLQKLRIQIGNRIVANFKVKLGQDPGTKETDLEKEEKKLLDQLKADYKKITDGVVKLPTSKKFKAQGLFDSYTEFCLMSQYMETEKNEESHIAKLNEFLIKEPIYNQFLINVPGCGVLMSSVIIGYFDIHKAKYISSMWAYAGLDVVNESYYDENTNEFVDKFRGRGKFKEHLVDVEYIDKEGNVKTKKSITFNPILKSKLLGVLAGCFIKRGNDCKYTQLYYNYKNRITNSPEHSQKSKKHLHNMAIRYAMKRFIVDLYFAWKDIEGLPIFTEYSEDKLKMIHTPTEVDKINYYKP